MAEVLITLAIIGIVAVMSQPNEVGKDIGFVTILYPDVCTIAVAPDVHKQNATSLVRFENAGASCTNQDKEYTLPIRDELLAMYC